MNENKPFSINNEEEALMKQLYYTSWSWKKIDDFFKVKFGKSSSSYHLNKLKEAGLIIEKYGQYELTEKGKAKIIPGNLDPIYENDKTIINLDLSYFLLKILNSKMYCDTLKEFFYKTEKSNQDLYDYLDIHELFISSPEAKKYLSKFSWFQFCLDPFKYQEKNSSRENDMVVAEILKSQKDFFEKWKDFVFKSMSLFKADIKQFQPIYLVMLNASIFEDLRVQIRLNKDIAFPLTKEMNALMSFYIFKIIYSCFLQNPYYLDQLKSPDQLNFEIEIKYHSETLNQTYEFLKKTEGIDYFKVLREKAKPENEISLDQINEDYQIWNELISTFKKGIFDDVKKIYLRDLNPGDSVPYDLIKIQSLSSFMHFLGTIQRQENIDNMDEYLIKEKIEQLKDEENNHKEHLDNLEKEIEKYKKLLKK